MYAVSTPTLESTPPETSTTLPECDWFAPAQGNQALADRTASGTSSVQSTATLEEADPELSNQVWEVLDTHANATAGLARVAQHLTPVEAERCATVVQLTDLTAGALQDELAAFEEADSETSGPIASELRALAGELSDGAHVLDAYRWLGESLKELRILAVGPGLLQLAVLPQIVVPARAEHIAACEEAHRLQAEIASAASDLGEAAVQPLLQFGIGVLLAAGAAPLGPIGALAASIGATVVSGKLDDKLGTDAELALAGTRELAGEANAYVSTAQSFAEAVRGSDLPGGDVLAGIGPALDMLDSMLEQHEAAGRLQQALIAYLAIGDRIVAAKAGLTEALQRAEAYCAATREVPSMLECAAGSLADAQAHVVETEAAYGSAF